MESDQLDSSVQDQLCRCATLATGAVTANIDPWIGARQFVRPVEAVSPVDALVIVRHNRVLYFQEQGRYGL